MERKAGMAWAAKCGLACGMMLLVSLVCGGMGRADEAMGYIPEDVNVVGSAQLRTLYGHAQLGFLRGMIEEDLDEEAEKVKAMKVFPDNIERLVFGVKPVVEEQNFEFVLVMEMKEDVDTDAFATFLLEEGDTADIAGQTVYASPDGSANLVILSPKRILVVTPGITEAVLSQASSVTANAKMMAVVNAAERKESLWVAALPTQEILAEFGADLPPFVMDLEGILITVNLAEKLNLQAVGTFSNEESSAAMMGLMQMAVPMVMMYGAEIDAEILPQATVDGKSAKLAISTAPDTIEKIGNYIMGMFMGGMGGPMMMDDAMIYIEDDE